MAKIPPPNAADSQFSRLRGDSIGQPGTSREVYSIRDAPDVVLKVSRLESNVVNWREIVAWHMYGEEGQCGTLHSWSRSGKYLVMERLDDIDLDAFRAFRWPEWVTDRKPSNLGRSSAGVVKVRDYAWMKAISQTSAYL